MRLRAVIIGLLSGAAVCSFCFFNDFIMRQTFLVGNYMPISVYGGLLLFLLIGNPILLGLSKRLALTGRDLAVIVALTLVACYVPGRGLMHYFCTFLMLPHHYARTQPGWKDAGVVDMAPKAMLAGVSPRYGTGDLLDAPAFAARLLDEDASPAIRRIRERIGAEAVQAARQVGAEAPEPGLVAAIVGGLDRAARDRSLYAPEAFADLVLPAEARDLIEKGPDSLDGEDAERLSRHLIDAAFPDALRSLEDREDLALNGFVQGLGVGKRHIALSQIPWYAWRRTLSFWLPLILAISIGMIGLALVVHRQWSDHEQMPYPIVAFAHALLPREGESRGGVFRNRLFWIGVAAVLLVHLNNYACEWWPRYLVRVPRYFDFRPLTQLLPALQRGGDWALMNPTIYFTAVGFAFFLATDVSLSLGIAPYLYSIVVGILIGYGVSVGGGGFISLNIQTFLFGGAYFGMFLVLLYTGRHYYLSVLRRSLFLPARDEVEAQAAWGARVFLVGALLFAGQLAWQGLPWYLAAAYTMGTVMIFLVISRLVAETGVFFIHAYHFPCVLLWGFLGAKALGPKSMLIMFMVTSLLLIDPRESVMPFIVQGLKLADLNRVKLGRVAAVGVVALVLAFAVAVPVTLFWQYDQGSGRVGDGWTRGVPRMSFDATVRVVEKLEAQGNLAVAGKLPASAWLRNLAPNGTCVLAFGITFALVLGFAAARLRFPRWPFHPVMFIVLGTFQSRTLAFSFLLGCLIKVLVTKYGGASAYRRLKPLMIGVIAGDMLGGLTPMLIGLVYYLATGEPPEQFKVLPS